MSQAIVVCLGALCVLAALLFVNKTINGHVNESHEKLRLELVASQWNDLRVQRLSEETENLFVDTVGEDISSLQVRIAELLTSADKSSEHVVKYEQRVLPEAVDHDAFLVVPLHNDFRIKIVRLSLSLQVPHGPYLLDWLQWVSKGTGGWPSDIRSCDIRKAMQAGLLADCVLDIYHWQMNSDV